MAGESAGSLGGLPHRSRVATICDAALRRVDPVLPGWPVFVAYPARFDFLFVCWYLMPFVGESPLSHSALDMKSYAMAVLGTELREARSETCRRMVRPIAAHAHRPP